MHTWLVEMCSMITCRFRAKKGKTQSVTASKEESNEQSIAESHIHNSSKIEIVNSGSSQASKSVDAKLHDVPAHFSDDFTTKTIPIKTAIAVRELSGYVHVADVDHNLPAARSVLNLKTESEGEYFVAVRNTPSLDPGVALRAKPTLPHKHEQSSIVIREWLRSRDTRMRGAMAVALEMEHAVAKLAYERSDPAVTQVRWKSKKKKCQQSNVNIESWLDSLAFPC
jgi:hypothetical protein